jgi:hypothetical protein
MHPWGNTIKRGSDHRLCQNSLSHSDGRHSMSGGTRRRIWLSLKDSVLWEKKNSIGKETKMLVRYLIILPLLVLQLQIISLKTPRHMGPSLRPKMGSIHNSQHRQKMQVVLWAKKASHQRQELRLEEASFPLQQQLVQWVPFQSSSLHLAQTWWGQVLIL